MGAQGVILIAEDSDDEIFIYKRAFTRLGVSNFQFVRDGVEVIEYLKGDGQYADRTKFPFPTCLWLDLKMPRKTGLDVLEWIQKNPKHSVVPTIVLSNSNVPHDIEKAYHLGAHSYFQKPQQLNEMVDLIALIDHYWKICLSPDVPAGGSC